MKWIALIAMTMSVLIAGCETKDLRAKDEKPLISVKVAQARGTFYRNLAEQKLSVGRLEDAYRLAKDANEMLEEDLDAKMLFARVCLEMNRPKEAMEALKPVVAEHPDHNGAIYLYGVCYESMGEYDKALGLFQVVSRREPESIDAAIAVAETLVILGRTEDARKAMDGVMPIAGNHLAAWEVSGRIEQVCNNYTKAVRCYRQCVAAAPSSATYVQLLADALWQDDQKNEAERNYRKFIRMAGKKTPVNVFRRLAVHYTEVGQVALARHAYQAATQADPKNLNHLLAQGRMECGLGEYDKAIGCCEKVLASRPNSEQAMVLKAYAQIELRKSADAVKTLLVAQKSHPRLALIYVMLGRAYTDLGDDEKARKCFKFVIRAAPKNEVAGRYLQYLRPAGPVIATTAVRTE